MVPGILWPPAGVQKKTCWRGFEKFKPYLAWVSTYFFHWGKGIDTCSPYFFGTALAGSKSQVLGVDFGNWKNNQALKAHRKRNSFHAFLFISYGNFGGNQIVQFDATWFYYWAKWYYASKSFKLLPQGIWPMFFSKVVNKILMFHHIWWRCKHKVQKKNYTYINQNNTYI